MLVNCPTQAKTGLEWGTAEFHSTFGQPTGGELTWETEIGRGERI